MATAAQYTDPYLATYTPVPAAGPGVCAVCHSGPNPGYAVCRSVPSTRAQMRLGKHPLETAVTRVGALASLYAPLLVRGPAHVDHNRADDLAFTVARRLRGARMLVFDDTLTTGARLQSAMSGARNPVQLRSMLPVPRLSGGAKGT
jgi:hypothetical protein